MAVRVCPLMTPGVKLAAVNDYAFPRLSRNSVGFYRASVITGRRRPNMKSRWQIGSCKCQLVDLASATSATYGALLLSGVNKSRSKGSLFGGLAGATLMTSAFFLMQGTETKAVGDAIGFGSAFLFSSVFGIRLVASQKLIPAGPLLGLSICALIVFFTSYFQDTL